VVIIQSPVVYLGKGDPKGSKEKGRTIGSRTLRRETLEKFGGEKAL